MAKRSDEFLLPGTGRRIGTEWATGKATVEELTRLSKFKAHASDDSWNIFLSPDYDMDTAGDRLAFVILLNEEDREDNKDNDAAADFWEHVIGEKPGDELNDAEFVRDFAEAALDAWDTDKRNPANCS